MRTVSQPLLSLSVLFVLSVGTSVIGQETVGYYRFPAIHGDTVVFTAEGDLWRVPLTGGTASRLTTHSEVESHAKFSPNGQTIAFAASYEGPVEIYTMPATGGRPQRVTYEGYTARRPPYPVSWKSGSELLYGTRYYARRDPPQIASVNIPSGERSVVPLEQASDGVYSPDGRSFYFTRLPRQSSHAKRYRGGYVENLWSWEIDAEEAKPLTANYDGTSRSPMLWNDRLYFASDRDGTMNLWSMSTAGADWKQHTRFKDFDVLSPDLHNGRIVFQRGADLWLYEVEEDETSVIPIRLTTDFDQKRTRWIKNPIDYLTDYNISADGKHVAVTVRGRGFVASVKPGRLVTLPQKPGTRFRSVAFLPSTRDVYYL
ncbi:MAG: protease, partial [Planctomycetota bacterium]